MLNHDTKKPITVRQARDVLKVAGLTLRATGWGDYRVGWRGDPADAAYFSDDLEDAFFTGLDMARRRASEAARRARRNGQAGPRLVWSN